MGVVVNTRNGSPELFESLEDMESNPTKERYANLCHGRFTSDEIGYSVEGVTHIIKVIEGKLLKTFGFLSISTSAEYAELKLLCGSYTSADGQKGSKLIVDKAIELARTSGKKALRLEPSEEDYESLLNKVYGPLGFTPLGDKELELRFPGGGSRLDVKRWTSKRHGRSRKHRKLRKLATRRR